MGTKNTLSASVLVIISGLCFTSSANAISIDGQLTVIRNDCYDRLAIGEKLSPTQVYKRFDHNTVSTCEKECTTEKEKCRAYSFGIGPKGNATCLLARQPIKETVDLKPVGTIKDPDYDLYVKKLDCQIVLEPPGRNPEGPHSHPAEENLPAPSNNHHNSVTGGGHQNSPSFENGVEHVQTMVSIAHGPDSVLHPVHDILVAGNTLGQDNRPPNGHDYGNVNGNLPPFRPQTLNQPYDDHHQLPYKPFQHYGDGFAHSQNTPYWPEGYPGDDRPDPRPPNFQGYGSGVTMDRRKYESYSNHHSSFESQTYNNFGPSEPHYNFYDHYHRPKPDFPRRYGSVIPHPNEYGRPAGHQDYLFLRPSSEYEDRRHERPRDPYGPNGGYSEGGPPLRLPSDGPPPAVYDDGGKPLSSPSEGYLYERPSPGHPQRPPPPAEYGDHPPFRPSPGHSQRPPVPAEYADHPPFRPSTGHSQRPPVPAEYADHPPFRPSPGHSQKPPPPAEYADHPPFSSTTSFRPPPSSSSPSGGRPSSTELSNHFGGGSYGHGKPGEYYYNNKGSKQVVTESVGYNGEKITSIITELSNNEDDDACFRRTMAGKRTVRSLVRKLSICETVEQCQQECGYERQFTCEGFNYRLDPTGRGKGECELLSLPISRIDLNREIVPAPDYDFYTRDRNARQVDCRQPPRDNYYPVGAYTGGGERGYGYGYEYYGGNRRNGIPYDRRPSDLARPLRPPSGVRWDIRYRSPPAPPPPPPIPRPRPPPLPPIPGDRRPDSGSRRGDYLYSHESHSSHSHQYNEHSVDRYGYRPSGDRYRPYTGVHYLPLPPKRVPVIVPLDPYPPRNPLPPDPEASRYPPAKGYWPEGWQYGYKYRYDIPRPNYYIPTRPPPKPQLPPTWGQYGGSYGSGSYDLQYHGYGKSNSYDYWGFKKFQGDHPVIYSPPVDGSYLPTPHPHGYLPSGQDWDNAIVPSPSGHDVFKDECSLRSAAGFRLHKGVVKKVITVLNIYDCELLCAHEKQFVCASYAFRYTAVHPPSDNCYLSTRSYKELDYYTDLEPDKECDIYAISNREKCLEFPNAPGKDESDCFWRVRSGQRLENSIVRDSLTVKSTVDCQLECIKSYRFVCRAYSFRYGSPVIGGVIDNCQLTDWPFYELDARHHFVPEPGFEIYERGSFGHGCEHNPFSVGGRGRPTVDDGAKLDQICYTGFGSASRLLPQAVVKHLWVPTEQDCKKECSTVRENTLFNCMTLSFMTEGSKVGPNCFLSDILQRDLLPNVDFIHDPNSWMFSWDNYNPGCVALAHKPVHGGGGGGGGGGADHHHPPEGREGDYYPLDVWKVYSVSGWPCKRGTRCKENKLAGFWYCDLEGGAKDAWDYCCSPDHHCGFSSGYPYSWCYVGAFKTQWRKCSDQYYPYSHHYLIADRFDKDKTPWDSSGGYPPPPQSQGFRPDRPNAPVEPPPPRPTLDEYEEQFNNEFLNPPKPGGLGQSRRWPVAYLHKELPPNVNSTAEDHDSRGARAESSNVEDSKAKAIKDLITILNDTDFQYNISNAGANRSDDALFVKIPIPSMSDAIDIATTTSTEATSARLVRFEGGNQQESSLKDRKSLPFEVANGKKEQRESKSLSLVDGSKASDWKPISEKRASMYRRGFVTRTNLTANSKGL